MSDIQTIVADAITRSIALNATTTVTIGSNDCMQQVYEALEAASPTEHSQWVDVTATLRDCWGWNADTPENQMEWRVQILQREWVGAGRFQSYGYTSDEPLDPRRDEEPIANNE